MKKLNIASEPYQDSETPSSILTYRSSKGEEGEKGNNVLLKI